MKATNLPWMDQARSKIGQHEVKGKKDNPFILECFKHTSYKADHDEVPWCAAFVNWCLDNAGLSGDNNAEAVKFMGWGDPCELKPGAIVVFRWESGSHHVTFCDHIIDDELVACLGGNQSDSVKI